MKRFIIYSRMIRGFTSKKRTRKMLVLITLTMSPKTFLISHYEQTKQNTLRLEP
jgi:hypothetical protein